MTNYKLPESDSYGVPNLKLDVLVVNSDCTRAKLNPNGEIMSRFESLVCELKQKTWFSNTYVTG